MDIHSKSLDPFITKLAKKWNLPKKEVREIIQSEFELVKLKFKQADSYNDIWPYIRLPLIGVFRVKEGKKEFLRNRSKKVIENVYSHEQQQSGDRAEDAPDPGI